MIPRRSCKTCRYSHENGPNLYCYGEKEPPIVQQTHCCPSWKPNKMSDYELGAWEMFENLSQLLYGKQCYFLQEDPNRVYSRLSGTYLSRMNAYFEFVRYIKENMLHE